MASDFIAHAEIPSLDLDKSKEFYKKLFGWEFKPFGNGYLLYNTHKGFTIGLRKADNIASGESTIFHVRVKDISESLTQTENTGGKIKRGKTTIPAMGYYALINDPDGNTVGLFQGSN
jgi:predicted enzyme related to lactoylglutathione lyase